MNPPRQPAIRLPGGGAAKPRKKGGGIGFGLFFAALGLLFAYFSWSQFNDHWTLRANGERVQGVIVGYDTVRGRRSTTYYPVLRYNTRDGATVQASATGSASPEDLPRGSRVALVYEKGNTSHVRLAASVDAGPGFTPWFLGFLALVMFGLGSIFFLPARARPPQDTAAPPGPG